MNERIDKAVSRELNIARSEARALIKSGAVALNGIVVKSIDSRLDSDTDVLFVNGRKLSVNRFVYIMMNKPEGVISSSDGRKTNEKTVIDILPPEFKRKKLFPAGRLDKNTTGFVLITDDGSFAHDILSPKKHIKKEYIAELDRPFAPDMISDFAQGIALGEKSCLPAELSAVNGDFTRARVVIRQGMYHQIKRMFQKYGIEVIGLKRISMGNLYLDESLKAGDCRILSAEELEMIKCGK